MSSRLSDDGLLFIITVGYCGVLCATSEQMKKGFSFADTCVNK